MFHVTGQPFKWHKKMMTMTATTYWTTTTPTTHQECDDDDDTHTTLCWDEAHSMERTEPPKVYTPTANDEDGGRALRGIDGLPEGVPDPPNNLPMAPLPNPPLGTPAPPNNLLSHPPQDSQ
ncbi:hypothetical protein EDD18DRAFT_1357553 [Armillaria luteobubalina]|uniref:Uncharacterized protein n=1 Tax=Armillaria luteobubalina TaxID=153913 RepID=A0AA39PYC3_9AGAR|nr:hypothetical protein EDD18DRAFT_1357553 [Armillaria luteobubalina]